MVRSAPYSLLAAAIAFGLAPGAPASGQCRLCADPSTTPGGATAEDDIRLDIETSINFDRLILFGAGTGSATLRPDGSSTAQGSVSDIGPRAMVGTAVVHGQAGRAVRVELPRRILLHSVSGGEISFDDVASDLPSLPRLDSAGNLTFRFGGRVTISGDSDGAYRGDLPITVEYQ